MKIVNLLSGSSVFIVIVIVLGLLGYALFGSHEGSVKQSPLIGKPAPQIELELFGGGNLSIHELKGKAVLINFWASWCGPCKTEAPALERSWLRYKNKNAIFIGVNIWDDKDTAEKYVKSFGGSFYNGFDPKGSIAVHYGISGVPETYFLDINGNVLHKYTGPLTEDIIDYFMSKALSPENKQSTIKPDQG